MLFPLVTLMLLGGCARPLPNTPDEQDVGGQEEGAHVALDEEAVKFKALHDWSRIELQDGRHLQVVFARMLAQRIARLQAVEQECAEAKQ